MINFPPNFLTRGGFLSLPPRGSGASYGPAFKLSSLINYSKSTGAGLYSAMCRFNIAASSNVPSIRQWTILKLKTTWRATVLLKVKLQFCNWCDCKFSHRYLVYLIYNHLLSLCQRMQVFIAMTYRSRYF